MQPDPNINYSNDSDESAKKAELDFLRYQLMMSQSANQELQSQLDEIKSSRAWMMITLYRKLLTFNNRVLGKIAREARRKDSQSGLSSKRSFNPAVTQDRSNRVAILTHTFFNLDGNNMFFGGAERYVIELVRLIREYGYEPEVYQCGNSDWERFYFDFKVIGLDVQGNYNLLSSKFYQLKRNFKLVIYSPFGLASQRLGTPSIGISHGIYWDAPIHYPAWIHAAKNASAILGAIENCTRIVSVDTNTINWVRATSLNKASNCMFIPNFVDLGQFQPLPTSEKKNRLTILYPRRLYSPRGFWLISDILPELLHDYPNVDIHFVGKADSTEEARVKELVASFPDRVKWYFLPPEKMHIAYQQADITLIPTLHSEGTSLSCLEALASGNAVIATNVGGLPDLILHGHNGLLIEPNASSLRRALDQLCSDAELRCRLQTNGRMVAEAFNIQRWREEWRILLHELLEEQPPSSVALTPSKFAVVVPPDGVDWASPHQAAHQTALRLAACGYQTFWINSTGRLPGPTPGLHILSSKDDLHLFNPDFYLFSQPDHHLFEQSSGAQIRYDAERDSIESLEYTLKQAIE